MPKNNGKSQKAAPKMPSVKAQIDRFTDGKDTSVKAYASAVIGNTFAIHGIRVIQGGKGTFVSMPNRSYKDENGNQQYSDIFHAVTKEGHRAIVDSVMDAYHQALEQADEEDFEEIVEEDEGLEQSM